MTKEKIESKFGKNLSRLLAEKEIGVREAARIAGVSAVCLENNLLPMSPE